MIGEGSRQSFVRRRKGRENFSTQSNEISFVALRVFKDSLHQIAGIKSDGLLLVVDVVVILDRTDFDWAEIVLSVMRLLYPYHPAEYRPFGRYR